MTTSITNKLESYTKFNFSELCQELCLDNAKDMSTLRSNLFVPCSWCASSPYMIFVRGANIFMWSNFATHENLRMLCGGKIAQPEKQFCSTTWIFLLVMWRKIAPHVKKFCSTSVSSWFVLLTQNPFCCDLRFLGVKFLYFLSIEQIFYR